MATLQVIVDFDNVDSSFKLGGVVALAKAVLSLVPPSTLAQYEVANVRLYGGWRRGGALTSAAQRLIPEIRASSPTTYGFELAAERALLRLNVELADKPLGHGIRLEETYVRERSLRKFRARREPWVSCNGSSCGFTAFSRIESSQLCGARDCSVRLEDIFVRDEQKMVDTLMVADIAKVALIDKLRDIVIVSSDTDMWPGLLLALHAGCFVTHIHTRRGGTTQQHLLRTLVEPTRRLYFHTCP